MIDKLIKRLEEHTILTEEECAFLNANIPVITLPKNHILLAKGEISKAFYFILNGSVRLFYQIDTEEKTAFFYFENNFFSSYESFTKQTPAKHNLQTIEASEIAVVSYEIAHKLLELYPKFEFLARVMMEEELIVCQEIISSFITENAEKRYLKLLKDNNQLLHRIPQYQIATFLGVAPETLSRIRKRISQNSIC